MAQCSQSCPLSTNSPGRRPSPRLRCWNFSRTSSSSSTMPKPSLDLGEVFHIPQNSTEEGGITHSSAICSSQELICRPAAALAGPGQTHKDCPALMVSATDVQGWNSTNHQWKHEKKAASNYDCGKKEQTCLVHPSFPSTLLFFLTNDLIFSKISLYIGTKQFFEMEMLSKANIHHTCDRPKDFYLLRSRARCFKLKKKYINCQRT